jgi:hypothetical protein
MNKTRSFNILGGMAAAGMHSFAAFAEAAQTPDGDPAPPGVKFS